MGGVVLVRQAAGSLLDSALNGKLCGFIWVYTLGPRLSKSNILDFGKQGVLFQT